ncbi:MAG: hypothetical protein QOH47_2504 [Sphingomonadales bacterium]|jgi:energy-coupling factor transporter transmembrane protein EcfT|nr:hypothetical protein [Sphingomonadales bacterium]
MLALHPIIRLAATLILCVAAFLVDRAASALCLYAIVAAGAAVAGVARPHLRFLLATLPLLAALLVIWALAAPPAAGWRSGVEVAFLFWIRICILSGSFQWLLLPLVEAPLHLKAFLAHLRLPAWATLLLITPIVFLPEVRRRIDRVVEARKAQGLPATGLRGLRALPEMMSPLVASMLEGALGRSELWSHRNLIGAAVISREPMPYSMSTGIIVAIAVPSAIGLAIWV